MIRKVLISILVAAFVVLSLAGNQSSTATDEEICVQKTNWTQQTNEYLLKLLEEAEGITPQSESGERTTLQQSDWEYFTSNNNIVTSWTTNEWVPDSSAFDYSQPTIIKHSSGADLLVPTQNGVLTHVLIRDESGEFDAINKIAPLNNVAFEIQKSDTTKYSLLNGEAYINFYGRSTNKSNSGIPFLIGWIFLLCAAFLSFRYWFTASLVIAVIAVISRILSFNKTIVADLDKLQIFDPVIFASSDLLPSLGDLMLHVLTGLIAGLAIIHTLKYLKFSNAWIVRVVFLLTCLFGVFSADLIDSLLRSLIANSNISFDVTHLSTISRYSIIAASIIALLFWIWFAVVTSVYNRIQKNSNQHKWFVVALLLAISTFTIFQTIDASRTINGLLPSILFSSFSLVFLYLIEFITKRKIGLYKYIGYILFFTFFFAFSLQKYQHDKESEYLNLYASKLISNKDLQAEYLFKDIEIELTQQFLVPEDFEAFSQKKEQFEQRLRRLYFSGYLDKYNMLVLSFDSAENNINSSTLYSYDDLNDIYNYKSFPTLSAHFYQVKSDRIFNGYLAKFENCDLNGHYGNVFILLEPKFIQSSYEYPQFIGLKSDNRLFDIDDYSYALYSNGKLLHQKGTYPYNLMFDTTDFHVEKGILSNTQFNHFISYQDQAIVVLSHPVNNLIRSTSTFSFSFIFFMICFFAFGLVWIIGMFVRQKLIKQFGSESDYKDFRFQRKAALNALGIEQVYLSTRIRLSMVILVFFGLLVSIYVTIQFIEVNDQSRSENELMYKIREVANQLQNEVDFHKKLSNAESRQLIVNEIGDIYKIDANLFNSNGRLLASSIEDIYKKGLIAPYMDPEAIKVFKEKNTSQLLHSESIRNLRFTSAYLPLINNKREVVAYLNLPYYSRQKELDAEISSYTVTFVNIYLFLILVAITLAYVVSQRISKPLQLIREKMSRTGLQTNELIEWKQNDEIGRLVKQYNKMVLQLGESANKLSESEREGAWKEMARQVAHEIKNPLTPMKLNIQHLQRAWSDKNERLEETFKRVTTVLIDQIDSLSKLATEFSSFAQMPVNNFEDCSITNSLLSTITLFEKSENVEFQYNENITDYTVHADKEQLGRIFNNIIKNAIQAIPEDRKGLIKASVTVVQNNIRVVITDNGKGISPEDKSKIFVPNFSTKNSGMGLGLAITKKMIEAANGSIWFETEVDKGTSFYIEWPLVNVTD